MHRTTWRSRLTSGGRVAGVILFLATLASSAANAASDPEAVAIAESVLDRTGGRDAWDATRYLRWSFAGRRLHHWDRETGDVRIESENRLVLMNLWSRSGRVWEGGEPLEGEALREALDLGYAWWVNDAYWLLMPVKLLDPGVNLAYGGETSLPDGRAADLLVVTFGEDVGLTPQNRYEVWVARDTGLVAQWAYYRNAADSEPEFTLPWRGWERFGEVLIATDHGRGWDWNVAAPEHVPATTFTDP